MALNRLTWRHLLLMGLISGIYLYAGIVKSLEPLAFADSIAAFKLVPTEAIAPITITLPIFEIFLSITLWIPRFRRNSAIGIQLLTFVFLMVQFQAFVRGLNVNCGCFGSQIEMSIELAMIRNLIIMASARQIVRFCDKIERSRGPS